MKATKRNPVFLGYGASEALPMKIVNYTIDALFFFDIFYSFRTAFVTAQGRMVCLMAQTMRLEANSFPKLDCNVSCKHPRYRFSQGHSVEGQVHGCSCRGLSLIYIQVLLDESRG